MLNMQLFANITVTPTFESCNMSELFLEFVALSPKEANKSVKQRKQNKFVSNEEIKGKWIMFYWKRGSYGVHHK